MNIAGIFKKPDFGLLVIRLVLGSTYVIHGLTKFEGGTHVLERVGSVLDVFGITAFPVFFGGLAALCEMLGGCLIFVGYKFRFAVFAVFLVMAIAFYTHFIKSGSFGECAWPLEMAAVFIGLLFIGPGKYSVDKG